MKDYVYQNPYVTRPVKKEEERQNVIPEEAKPAIQTQVSQANESVSKQKVIVRELLPLKLKEAIEELQLSSIMTWKAYKLCCILIRKSVQRDSAMGYVSLSVKYLETVFGKDYHKDFFNQLKQTGIIETDDSYKQGSKAYPGYSKTYRLNPELLQGKYTEVFYKEKSGGSSDEVIRINMTYNHDSEIINSNIKEQELNKTCKLNDTVLSKPSSSSNSSTNITIPSSQSLISSSQSSTSPISPLHISTRFFRKQLIFDDLSSLKYDKDELEKTLQERLSNISTRFLKTGAVGLDNSFKVRNLISGKTYYVKKENAVAWCDLNNATIIHDDRMYIDNVDSYVQRKKNNVRFNYEWQIAKLLHDSFFANRNEGNHRLDHNLTILPKSLLKVIKDANELVEIDLRNSQFAIHAFWMKQEKLVHIHQDVREYYRLCTQGNLYDELAEKLSVSREEAKQMMGLAFSSERSTSDLKKEFEKHFPNVLKHITDFKKKNGSKKFSVELQQLEAEIFIDNLYPLIKSKGFFCLTRHDSLLVKKKDKDQVVAIMQQYFEYLEFECTICIEGKYQKLGIPVEIDEDIPAWLYELEIKQRRRKEEIAMLKADYGNRLV